jgi:hypothetical protein
MINATANAAHNPNLTLDDLIIFSFSLFPGCNAKGVGVFYSKKCIIDLSGK